MKKYILLGAAALVLSSPVIANPGGEGNNTGCNGVGNINSPCDPADDGNGGSGGSGGNGGNGGSSAVGDIDLSTTSALEAYNNAVGGNSTSASNATGGNSTSTSASGAAANGGNVGDIAVGGSGPSTSTAGSATSGNIIDASSRHNVRVTYIPTVTQVTPSSSLGVGNIIKETLSCGPLQAIQRTAVDGKFYRIFGSSNVPQGWTDELVPLTDENGNLRMYLEYPMPDGSISLMGHQPVIYTTIVGVSSNRNVSIGGGSGGDWGQGGMGTSSANQRMITSIQLRYCQVGVLNTEPKIVEVMVEVPPKTISE